MTNKNLINPSFKKAITDYYYLLNKNYPEKESLKLVGNRYRLKGDQRNTLFRGITSDKNADLRKAKKISLINISNQTLYIDGYNVFFTIMNYMLGKAIFLGNDGILRDCGGDMTEKIIKKTNGKNEIETILFKSVDLVLNFLPFFKKTQIVIYLDLPVSNSNVHKKIIENKPLFHDLSITIHLLKWVDKTLCQIQEGIIVTSDSQIIQQSQCPILDLAREVLSKNFNIHFINLSDFLEPVQE